MRVPFHGRAFQSFLHLFFVIIEMYSLDVSSYSKALGSQTWTWHVLYLVGVRFSLLNCRSCDFLQRPWTERRCKCISQALDGVGFKKNYCKKPPLQSQKISLFFSGGNFLFSCIRTCMMTMKMIPAGDSKCPFHPLVGGHLTPWKGHLTIPKRSLWITRHQFLSRCCAQDL